MLESFRLLCCAREERDPPEPAARTPDVKAKGKEEKSKASEVQAPKVQPPEEEVAAVEEDEEVCTLRMKEQLERVRATLFKVIDDEVGDIYDRADASGSGSISFDDVKELFQEWGLEPPPKLKAFDFNRSGNIQREEVEAIMKFTFANAPEETCKVILMQSQIAREWVEESWKLGVRSTDKENGEVVIRAQVLVDLFSHFEEINKRGDLNEDEIRVKIKEYDTDSSGVLTFSEYQNLYLFFLATMYEDLKGDNASNASEDAELDAAAFKEHMANIKTELNQVLEDAINSAFRNADPDNFGHITFGVAERVYKDYATLDFHTKDDGTLDDMVQQHEFVDLVKKACETKDMLCRAVLRDDDRVKNWSAQAWKMCIQKELNEDTAILGASIIIHIMEWLSEVNETDEFDEELATEMLDEFDLDKTGSIAKDEFHAFFLKILSLMVAALSEEKRIAQEAMATH
eukprot:TRINITY_DN5514_c1_g2_i1.p1 TRINITY_DN5514_c1_g2~~TRINITY_DN5514_c1_g2_i1.p1  ORF type:complete len:459 (-),score=76.38 TRINITY_DN5514_c1_g2_i1:382-1758(-)